MKIVNTLLTAACFAMPVAATAATFGTLVYEATGTAFIGPSLVPGFELEGSFFDDAASGVIVGVTGDAVVDTDLNVTSIASTLFVSDSSGALLESSTVVSTETMIVPPSATGAPTEDTFKMVFGDLSGDDADLFGDTALVVFNFFAESEDLGFLSPVTARIYSDLAPIPLPASLPLLAGALLSGAIVARKRSRKPS